MMLTVALLGPSEFASAITFGRCTARFRKSPFRQRLPAYCAVLILDATVPNFSTRGSVAVLSVGYFLGNQRPTGSRRPAATTPPAFPRGGAGWGVSLPAA